MFTDLYPHPGFTISQFFEKPAIPIKTPKVEHFKFKGGEVKFEYNSYGYRTNEFDKGIADYILVAGCSLTEGHGLHLDQTWGKKLEHTLNLPVVNLAKGGANSEFTSQNLINWVDSSFPNPKVVIAQWPTPYRLTNWYNNRAKFVLNKNADELYKLSALHGHEYFYLRWIKNIVELDQKCNSATIPVLHICFESPDQISPSLDILDQYQIKLHLDHKLPGLTWHFDNSALDGLHHSEWCTEKWSQRILTLLETLL